MWHLIWVVQKDDYILFYPLKSIDSAVGVCMKKQVIYTTPSLSLNDYEFKHSSWKRFELRTKIQRVQLVGEGLKKEGGGEKERMRW